MGNSLIVMVSTTTATVFICALGFFCFCPPGISRQEFLFQPVHPRVDVSDQCGHSAGLFCSPAVGSMGLHLIDSLSGVILVQIAFQLSGNIMILKGFFTAIPRELQDAAYMDGCTNFDFFWRIMLPLVKPALAAVAALVMIVSWNDLLVPLIVLNSNNLWTLQLGTMQFQGQYSTDLALVSAFVALSSIPTIIFYFFAEKQIVAGLTAGAVKG